jgi:hypothetical protein
VLPSKAVKERIAPLAVGLAADCDSPESEVEQIMAKNLSGANTLPFAGFLTHDLKWVSGFSGYKDEAAFAAFVESAEKSPLLEATEAVRKKLAELAAKAGKAAEKGEWKAVLAAGREADATSGRCPDRAALAEAVKKARAWAEERFGEAIAVAREGKDLAEARKALEAVRKQFSGEPEAAEADAGFKALTRLGNIRAMEEKKSGDPKALREKAAKDHEGSRWAAVFGTEPAPREPKEDGQ